MIEYKRGTYFAYTGIAKLASGLPASLVGCTVKSQLRTYVAGRPTTLVADLDGQVLDGTNGVFQITYDQTEAAEWALQTACLDIVFVFPGGERVPTQGYIVIKIIDPSTQEPTP